jgi:hypothetical protein
LIILDADAVEQQKFHSVATIKPNDEFYLPIELLYSRITPRLYFTIQQFVRLFVNEFDRSIEFLSTFFREQTDVEGGILSDFIRLIGVKKKRVTEF